MLWYFFPLRQDKTGKPTASSTGQFSEVGLFCFPVPCWFKSLWNVLKKNVVSKTTKFSELNCLLTSRGAIYPYKTLNGSMSLWMRYWKISAIVQTVDHDYLGLYILLQITVILTFTIRSTVLVSFAQANTDI